MMNNNNKILFLFTDSFPYNTNEVYLETEILYLSKYFEKIIIFPINITGKVRKVPLNVEIVNIHKTIKNARLKFFLKSFWLTLNIYLNFKNNSSDFKNFKKKMLLSYNALLYAEAIERFIKEKNIDSSNLIVYSYWFLHWSFIISILKKSNSLLKAYSRAHMGDLYDDLCDHTFSGYKLQYLDKVFPISKDGQKHLAKLFPNYENKIDVSYLGVNYIAHNPVKETNSDYVIASCSSMNSQKRIEAFFEILGHTKCNITWVHFGGMDSEIKALKHKIDNLPPHIKSVFHGYTPNQNILEYYKNNHVDLFLNLSLSEGIPVTIMEAISFGIPAMATNVCGSPEIVCYDKKMIIDKNFDAKEVAQSIECFLLNEANDKNYRDMVFNFWGTHFNAEINYETFTKLIAA